MSDRGQTTLDFTTGASLFLITVAFVFAFVPGMFQPFDGGQDGVLVADRVADTLASDLLARPDGAYVLNATCTDEFFDADGERGDCRYAADASDLRAALGLDTTRRVNVTLARGGVVRYSAGGDPSDAENVVDSRRLVSLGGETHRLRVRVW